MKVYIDWYRALEFEERRWLALYWDVVPKLIAAAFVMNALEANAEFYLEDRRIDRKLIIDPIVKCFKESDDLHWKDMEFDVYDLIFCDHDI